MPAGTRLIQVSRTGFEHKSRLRDLCREEKEALAWTHILIDNTLLKGTYRTVPASSAGT